MSTKPIEVPAGNAAADTAQKILFKDVDKNIPEKFKKKLELIEEIIETNQESFEKVYSDIEESIEKSGESVNFIYRVIEHALSIRFQHIESLLSLLSLLLKKHGYEKVPTNIRLYSMLVNNGIIKKEEGMSLYSMKELLEVFPENSPAFSIIHDDVDTFIKKSSEPSFNAKESFKIDSKSPLFYVRFADKVSYLQAMAYFGAVKCFKYAIINESFSLEGIENYAVAGGNMEIIHLLEQKGLSFAKFLFTCMNFHRYEVGDWILLHYECKQAFRALYGYNFRAFFFQVLNKIDLRISFADAVGFGYLDIVKYLVEECHFDVEAKDISGRTPLHIALENGHLDIVKYLVEECHANIETKDEYVWAPLHTASYAGHLNIVKYLVEECHCNVEIVMLKQRIMMEGLNYM